MKKVNFKKLRAGIENKKEENFSDWYTELITKTDLIDYYDVSGCYILKPDSYKIWEIIKNHLDKELQLRGVKNCYFPLFIPQKCLTKEKEHLEDFVPEVSWVTHTGSLTNTKLNFTDDQGNDYSSDMLEKLSKLSDNDLKLLIGEDKFSKIETILNKIRNDSTELDEPLAIRPTSETAMYKYFAKWIKSHRDLPLKLNQWNNVVRWEFKKATPFIRSREFLWQEGHTAHTNEADAIEEVDNIIELYHDIYKDLLAIPTIIGTKTEKEKFAGAVHTKTIETYIQGSGKAIQAATSHYLGTNFSKMFDISYVSDNDSSMKEFVHQNSWGFTTRSIGIMLMVHSDNIGLVLPPYVAPIQIAIVPIYNNKKPKQNEAIDIYVKKEFGHLNNRFRVYYDNRKDVSVGQKFTHYDMRGVPLRIDVGPRDVKNGTFDLRIRDLMEKETVSLCKLYTSSWALYLMKIHQRMLHKAQQQLQSAVRSCNTLDKMFTHILQYNSICLAPFCGKTECEESIRAQATEKYELAMKSLACTDELLSPLSFMCINCGSRNNIRNTYFGKSY